MQRFETALEVGVGGEEGASCGDGGVVAGDGVEESGEGGGEGVEPGLDLGVHCWCEGVAETVEFWELNWERFCGLASLQRIWLCLDFSTFKQLLSANLLGIQMILHE